jgi:spore maturation protein CgeB
VYDRLLVTREVNVAEVAPLNPRVEFFPFAYEPSIHRPISIPPGEAERWGVDVVFVGTYAPHRAAMLEWLVAAVPARYAVHGNSWEKLGSRSPLRPFVTFADVKLDDQAKALGGAKIALGFLRKENRDEYTQRTFEIPACGGLMLAERTAAHLALFREGEEAEFFDPDDPAELIAKVQDLLADPVRRERVRAGGMAALTRCDHTYDDRVRRLLAAYHRDAPALTSA